MITFKTSSAFNISKDSYSTNIEKIMSEKMKPSFLYEVIVVDDDSSICDDLPSLFGRLDIRTTLCQNLNDAIFSFIKKIPDLLVIKLKDDETEENYRVIKGMKNNNSFSYIPIIIISDSRSGALIEDFLKIGVNDYFIKPFIPTEVALKAVNLIKLKSSPKNNYTLADNSSSTFLNLDDSYKWCRIAVNFSNYVDISIENLLGDVNLEIIANSLGTTVRILNQSVKSFFNTTPTKLVIQKKLEKANLLLHNQDLSIKQVAYESGFNSVSYFCTIFKLRYGQRPKKIKREFYYNL